MAKHLGVVKQAGMVLRSRVGRESRLSIRQESLVEVRRYLETASRPWGESTVLPRFVVRSSTNENFDFGWFCYSCS